MKIRKSTIRGEVRGGSDWAAYFGGRASHGTAVTVGDDPAWTFTAAVIEEERWNGWLQPHFTEEEGRRIAAVSRAAYDAEPEATQEFVEVRDGYPPHARFWMITPAEGQEWQIGALNVDGVWLYAIGAANWTWSLAE